MTASDTASRSKTVVDLTREDELALFGNNLIDRHALAKFEEIYDEFARIAKRREQSLGDLTGRS